MRTTKTTDHQPTIIDQLQRWWRQDPRVHRLQPGWDAFPALAGSSPAELLERDRRNPAEGEAILAGLVRLADRDQVAALTAVILMLPAVKGLMVRLRHDGENHDDLSALIVDLMVERIKTYPWRSRQGTVAGNVSADVLKAVVRGRPKTKTTPVMSMEPRDDDQMNGQRKDVSLGLNWEWAGVGTRSVREQITRAVMARDSGASAAEELHGLLHGAVRDGLLSTADAEVIADYRLRGVSAEEVATFRGVKAQSARRRRQRAEATLREALAAA